VIFVVTRAVPARISGHFTHEKRRGRESNPRIRQSDCVFSSVEPGFPRTLHRNAKAHYGCVLD
jgi:hypothetical protein